MPDQPIEDTPTPEVPEVKDASEPSEPFLSLSEILNQKLGDMEFDDKGESDEKPVQDVSEKPKAEETKKTSEKPVEKQDEIKSKIPDEITKKIAGVEEKKEDAPVIPEELPKEKAAQIMAYKNMRELNKRLTQENSELKKNKPVASEETSKELQLLKAEYENLKKSNEEYENELRLHKLESTQFYKNNIAKPLQSIKDTATKLAKQYEVRASDVMEAFNEPDIAKRNAMLSELTAGFNDYDKLTLLQQADTYSRKMLEDKTLRGQAREALDFFTSKQKEEEMLKGQSVSKIHNQAADDTFKYMTENFGFMQKVEGNDEWNNEIDEINKAARMVDVAKLSPKELSEMKYLALSFPRVVNVLKAYAQELQARNEKLSQMRKSTPDMNKGTPIAKEDTDDSGLSFIEAINKRIEQV